MCISPELSATRLNTREAVITANAFGLWRGWGNEKKKKEGSRQRTGVSKGEQDGVKRLKEKGRG